MEMELEDAKCEQAKESKAASCNIGHIKSNEYKIILSRCQYYLKYSLMNMYKEHRAKQLSTSEWTIENKEISCLNKVFYQDFQNHKNKGYSVGDLHI